MFLWVTTRRRQVGLGYGWLLRSIYAFMAGVSLLIGLNFGISAVRDTTAACVMALCLIALIQSYSRRWAGVAGLNTARQHKRDRVAEMIRREQRVRVDAPEGPEFEPGLDLFAGLVGLVGLAIASFMLSDQSLLTTVRILTGALFLGAVSDAMLLGHWYLVQPGLSRAPLLELVRSTAVLWFPEVMFLLLPTGMLSVLAGTIDDGYGGMLGWFWFASAVTTLSLVVITLVVLRGREYSAVMAATGLMYLAILTAFATDLVARALLGSI